MGESVRTAKTALTCLMDRLWGLRVDPNRCPSERCSKGFSVISSLTMINMKGRTASDDVFRKYSFNEVTATSGNSNGVHDL